MRLGHERSTHDPLADLPYPLLLSHFACFFFPSLMMFTPVPGEAASFTAGAICGTIGTFFPFPSGSPLDSRLRGTGRVHVAVPEVRDDLSGPITRNGNVGPS